MSSGYPSFTIVGRSGAFAGRTLRGTGQNILIGRGSDCTLVINDSEISRHHARLSFGSSGWQVEDLGSTNGTFVNGQRVSRPHALQTGDTLGLGTHTFLFQPGEPATMVAGQRAPVAAPIPPSSSPAPQRSTLAWVALGGALGLLVILIIAALAAGGYMLLQGGSDAESGPQVALLGSPPTTPLAPDEMLIVQFSALDPAGIVRSELWVDGQLAGEQVYPAPNAGGTLVGSHSWAATTPGSHYLSVRVINADGQTAETSPILVSVAGKAEAEATATETPVPTATPEPAIVPTATPTETPTLTPEPVAAEPTPTATTTTAPPTATPTPTTTPVTGVFNDFETPTTWTRGDEPNGTFTRTSEQARSGSYSGRLDYNFPTTGNDYVVFLWSQPLPGRPNQLTAWVRGDGSGHFLNAWINDNGGQTWQFTFGQVAHTGWRQMTAYLDPSLPWPADHISGPNNGVIDYPISFTALVLDDVPDTFVGSGTIYIDDLASGVGTPPTATPEPTNTPTATTTPSATDIRFWADRTTINRGECTTLRWEVQNVESVYLDGEGVVGSGSREVCPAVSHSYVLAISLLDGSVTDRYLLITVIQP